MNTQQSEWKKRQGKRRDKEGIAAKIPWNVLGVTQYFPGAVLGFLEASRRKELGWWEG